MSDLATKARRIADLLPYIFYHLDFHPNAMQIRRYGQSDGTVRPAQTHRDCNGRCHTCLAYQQKAGISLRCPPEEAWIRVRDTLRRRYPLTALEDCMTALASVHPTAAQAVWALYVEPWPDPNSEPIGAEARQNRDNWAALGLYWMAEHFQGDVPEWGSDKTRKERIEEMLADQVPVPVIARREGCSTSYVRRIRRGTDG